MKVKLLKPDDWWIVADDDELQLYSKPIETIVQECEELDMNSLRVVS